MQKKNIAEKIVQSKKLLHRALKTAKGFERQKLGKRLKTAIETGKHEDVRRINAEIQALKALDLDKTTDAHLHKSLLKVKAIADSELLPDDVKREIEKPWMGEEERKALHNVTSGMYNMKPVKDTTGQILKEMCAVLGVPAPIPGKANKEPLKDTLKGSAPSTTRGHDKIEIEENEDQEEKIEPSWDGFDSESKASEGDPDIEGSDDEENTSKGNEEDLDDETISKYDALLGGSSDEESFDEEIYKANRLAPPSNRLSLSLSPSPSTSPSDASVQSQSVSPSPPPSKAPKISKTNKPKESTKASTFLPSLMGGYWSGSESSASDLEDEAPRPIRKNRKGQMARRAIYEKKFKEQANHIKAGKGSVAQRKDDGWDPKRGAKDSSSSRGRGGLRQGGGRGARPARDLSKGTGENSMPVREGARARGAGKKDDVGVLHPSWQAAKKAKIEQKQATFAGKKVVFD